MLRHEAGAVDEHAAGAAGRVENPTVKRLQHLDEQANNTDRRVELAAPRTLRASELTEEILIDPPERVALGGRWNLRYLLEQVLQERTVKNLVRLWQDACELRILRLDVPHGLIDGLADVRSFRQPQDMVESCWRRQVKDALGLIGGRIVHAGATPSPSRLFLQHSQLREKANLGKP